MVLDAHHPGVHDAGRDTGAGPNGQDVATNSGRVPAPHPLSDQPQLCGRLSDQRQSPNVRDAGQVHRITVPGQPGRGHGRLYLHALYEPRRLDAVRHLDL